MVTHQTCNSLTDRSLGLTPGTDCRMLARTIRFSRKKKERGEDGKREGRKQRNKGKERHKKVKGRNEGKESRMLFLGTGKGRRKEVVI